MNTARTGFWTRVVADADFAEAVIDDPLRALSDVDDVEVSAEQVRQLEEMSRDERSVLVDRIMRETFLMNAIALYGPVAVEGPIDLPPCDETDR